MRIAKEQFNAFGGSSRQFCAASRIARKASSLQSFVFSRDLTAMAKDYGFRSKGARILSPAT